MAAPPRPNIPATEAAITAMLELSHDLYRQDKLGGVLEMAVSAATRLGAPAHIGCLMRDPGADAWYLTAMIDSVGRPTLLSKFNVSYGPFEFTPPRTTEVRPLTDALGAAWGRNGCVLLERYLGTVGTLCVPLEDERGVRGALLALLTTLERVPVIQHLLANTALSAVRMLDQEQSSADSAMLDARAFALRAEDEISRAQHYRGEAALVVCHAESLAELARLGPALARQVGKWDAIGRLDTPEPALAILLPETSVLGGHDFLRGAGKMLYGLPVGVAACPEDAKTLSRLIEIARGRAFRAKARVSEQPGGPPDTHTWQLNGVVAPDMDVIRCPKCLVSYSRLRPENAGEAELERARTVARAVLYMDCPRHHERIVAG
jgi:hypothetical protein